MFCVSQEFGLRRRKALLAGSRAACQGVGCMVLPRLQSTGPVLHDPNSLELFFLTYYGSRGEAQGSSQGLNPRSFGKDSLFFIPFG